MAFIVKICGNKPTDIPVVWDVLAGFNQMQLSIHGEHKIDPRMGLLVGQKHPSPDFIAAKKAAEIIRDSPTDSMVVVTHLDELSQLIDLIGETNASTIQLHKKDPNPETVEQLKSFYPDRRFWHVIHAPENHPNPTHRLAIEQNTLAAANELIVAGIEAIVLDTFNVTSGQVGGTGLAVNDEYAKRFSSTFRKNNPANRLILAGGLKPQNVIRKISIIRPDGVDANTGLNIPGLTRAKDQNQVRLFLERALEGIA